MNIKEATQIVDNPPHNGKFKLELYDFQKKAVEFMEAHPRCLNASEMGVGKTVEALKLCQELNLRHVLIICPKTLVGEWFMQTDRITGEGALTPHENSQYEHRLSGLDLKGPRFVCVNYDLLPNSKCWSALTSVKWDCIIADECHKLKNHKSKRTQAMYLLAPYATRVVLMSGTPLQNYPTDLFPLFHLMEPSKYRSYNQWVEWFCQTVLETVWVRNKNGTPVPRQFKQIVGSKNTEQLNQLLHFYMHRDLKKDVLPELPDKVHRTIPVSLGHERKQYEEMKKELFALLDNGEVITAPAVIAQITRLRQITLDPNLLASESPRPSTPSNKTATLLELIEGTEDKIVIYTYFERYTQILSQELSHRNIEHVLITGQVPTMERARNIDTFQSGSKCRVCLCTITAGGEGITLTASHIVVFTDRAWNPATNWQAEDRLHRIGQKNSVLVVDLYCQGTIEDHLLKIVRRKEDMIEKVVTAKVIESMRRERGN